MYLIGTSSIDSNLSRIIELSAEGNVVLKERTLTEIPQIVQCRMVRVAGKLSFTQLPLNAFVDRRR